MKLRQSLVALAVTGSLVLGACGGGSSGATVKSATFTSASDAVSMSGVAPQRDGFSFPNFASSAVSDQFNETDMVSMFGSGTDVCVGGGTPCKLTAEAAAWARMVNQARSSGHCEGLAVLSETRFMNKQLPDTFSLKNQGDVTHAIMRAFATQFLNEVQDITKSWAKKSLTDIAATLSESFKAGKPEYTLGVYTQDGGHAILPYAVESPSKDVLHVKVYDSNWPGKDRYVEFNLATKEWKFAFAGQNPDSDQSAWSGKAGDLDITPLDARKSATCPFCKGESGVKNSLLLVRSALPDWTIESVDGTLKPGSLVKGSSSVRPLRSGMKVGGNPQAPTDYLVSTHLGTKGVTMKLGSAARVVSVTPDSVIEVSAPSGASTNAITITDQSAAVDDPHVVLTLATENLVATSAGAQNVLTATDKGVAVSLVAADGSAIKTTATTGMNAIEVRTSEADGMDPSVKYQVVSQVSENTLQKKVVLTTGEVIKTTETGVLEATKTEVVLAPTLVAPPTKPGLPTAEVRDLSAYAEIPAPTATPVADELLTLADPDASSGLTNTDEFVPGAPITVKYSGFKPLEWVQLTVMSTPKVLATQRADADGNIVMQATLPSDLEEGPHTLAVYQPSSKRGYKQSLTNAAKPKVAPTTTTVPPTTTTIPPTTTTVKPTTTTTSTTTTTTTTTSTVPPTSVPSNSIASSLAAPSNVLAIPWGSGPSSVGLRVSWTIPASINTSPTSFDIYYMAQGSQNGYVVNTASYTNEFDINYLSEGVIYEVKVVAKNATTSSAASPTVTAFAHAPFAADLAHGLNVKSYHLNSAEQVDPANISFTDSNRTECQNSDSIASYVQYDWGYGPIASSDYSCSEFTLVHLAGYITIPGTAGGPSKNVNFHNRSDDGFKLIINGTTIINDMGIKPWSGLTGTAYLAVGVPLPIDIWYFDYEWDANAFLYWDMPGVPTQIIPPSAFTLKAPMISSATEGNGSVTLQWIPASHSGTKYHVEWSSDPTFTTNTTTFDIAATSFIVNGLTNGTTYYFRIKGCAMSGNTCIGTTNYSYTSSAVPHLPTGPVMQSATEGSGFVTFSWSAMNHGGDNYRVYWGTDPTFASAYTMTGTTNTSFTATATAGTHFYFRVAGWNNSVNPQVATTDWSYSDGTTQ